MDESIPYQMKYVWLYIIDAAARKCHAVFINRSWFDVCAKQGMRQ